MQNFYQNYGKCAAVSNNMSVLDVMYTKKFNIMTSMKNYTVRPMLHSIELCMTFLMMEQKQ